jgi:hypothetical protein
LANNTGERRTSTGFKLGSWPFARRAIPKHTQRGVDHPWLSGTINDIGARAPYWQPHRISRPGPLEKATGMEQRTWLFDGEGIFCVVLHG